MNAEISLGTIATVSEAVEWLGYTYLYGRFAKFDSPQESTEHDFLSVRMRRNPFLYGKSYPSHSHEPSV